MVYVTIPQQRHKRAPTVNEVVAHLMSDTSLQELVAFAKSISLDPTKCVCVTDVPYFKLNNGRRIIALYRGAIPVDRAKQIKVVETYRKTHPRELRIAAGKAYQHKTQYQRGKRDL